MLVFVREELLTAFLDEEAGELEVAGFAGDPPEFNEGEFDFRMTGIAEAFAGGFAENGINAIGKADGDVEQGSFAGGLVMRDGSLEQVAGAVEFVPVAEVGPALVRGIDLEMGVQVAVRLLGGGDFGDDRVQATVERGVGIGRERIRSGFQSFVQVGVHEHRTGIAGAGTGGGEFEVPDVTGLFEHGEVHGDGTEPVGFAPGRPEGVVDDDLGEGDAAQFEHDRRISGGVLAKRGEAEQTGTEQQNRQAGRPGNRVGDRKGFRRREAFHGGARVDLLIGRREEERGGGPAPGEAAPQRGEQREK